MNYMGEKQKIEILRGDIITADLSLGISPGFKGVRPCLVIQNDIGNKVSPTVTVIPLTSATTKREMKTHVQIEKGKFGLTKTSNICIEGMTTIAIERFKEKIGCVDSNTMIKVENAVLINLGYLNNNNE